MDIDTKKRRVSSDEGKARTTESSKKLSNRRAQTDTTIMMETAAASTISDPSSGDDHLTPMDDCVRYLERNPIMREIIGALIREEEEEGEKTEATTACVDDITNSMPSQEEESCSVIQKWMDRFEPPATLCDWQSDLDYQDYEYSLAAKKKDEDSGQYHKTDCGAMIVVIPDPPPPPPTEPSPTAALRAITVHFQRYRNHHECIIHSRNRKCACYCSAAHVKGFTMKYSDGMEVRSDGCFQADKTIDLQLLPNEHITLVSIDYDDSIPDPSDIFFKVRFLTTKERELEACVDSKLEDLHPLQDSWYFETGKVLRGLTWDSEELCITGFSSVPMASIDMMIEESESQENHHGAIPTLQKLAYDAAILRFKNEAKILERNGKTNQRDLVEKAITICNRVNEEHRQKLQTSPEATFYRTVDSLLSKAGAHLTTRARDLINSATTKKAEIEELSCQERRDARRVWAKQNLSVLKEHHDLLDSRMEISDFPMRDDTERLCFTPECRKLFHYNKVAQHRRCTAPGCMVDFPNCGCSVTECGSCHKVLCRLHLHCHKELDCPCTAR